MTMPRSVQLRPYRWLSLIFFKSNLQLTHQYSDLDPSRIPNWIKNELDHDGNRIWSDGNIESLAPGTWRTGNSYYLGKSHTILENLKSLNPNTDQKYFSQIEHSWYRDGELFIIPRTDQVMQSDFHHGNNFDDYPKSWVHNGVATEPYNPDNIEFKTQFYHIENAHTYCENLGGVLYAPHSKSEFRSLFETSENPVCNQIDPTTGSTIQLFLNLERNGRGQDGRENLDLTKWTTTDPWFGDERSNFCKNTRTYYDYSIFAPNSETTSPCDDLSKSPPSNDCWDNGSEPPRYQQIRESATLSMADLETGHNVYQRDCMQVQCDNRMARWQQEPCNSNNFLPVCRIQLLDLCSPVHTCTSSKEDFCGDLSKQKAEIKFKNPNYVNDIESILPESAFDSYEMPTYFKQLGADFIVSKLVGENSVQESQFSAATTASIVPFDSNQGHATCPCTCPMPPAPYFPRTANSLNHETSDIFFKEEDGTIDKLILSQVNNLNHANNFMDFTQESTTDRTYACNGNYPEYHPKADKQKYFHSQNVQGEELYQIKISCREITRKNTNNKIIKHTAAYVYVLNDNTIETIPFRQNTHKNFQGIDTNFIQQHKDFCSKLYCNNVNGFGDAKLFSVPAVTLPTKIALDEKLNFYCDNECEIGTRTKTCVKNGLAPRILNEGQCEAVVCEGRPSLIGSKSRYVTTVSAPIKDIYNCKDTITIECIEGYDMFENESKTINFQATCTKSDFSPTRDPNSMGYHCKQKCHLPKGINIDNTQFQSKPGNGGQKTQFYTGDTVNVLCGAGYVLEENNNLEAKSQTCVDGSFPDTVCEKKRCQVPSEIEHGYWYDPRGIDKFYDGDEVVYF